MRKSLLGLMICVSFLMPHAVKGQSFSVKADTMSAYVSGAGTEFVYDYIINNLHTPVYLKWTVSNTDFPASWLTAGAFGICDNITCYANASPKWLWSPLGTSSYFKTAGYSDTTTHGDFHLQLGFAGAVVGTHWVTITLTDTVTSYSKNMTFVITKVPAAVPVVRSENEVMLYPNPAASELNVVYNQSADVKSISVYNMLGKVMTVYKLTGNNSANLNLDNLTPGIYFIRLVNSSGETVATRKFTKQ